ncbi:MAG: hypothetical protein U1E23_17115 [Reyranellaceae bacterium]
MPGFPKLLATFVLLLAGQAVAQESPGSQYRGLTALDIPYANGPITVAHVPQIWLGLHGSEPRRFGMDTGSTGIVVSAEHYRPGPGDSDDGPGQLTYNSSGRVLHGQRHTTDVVILRDRETPLATARVQVLRVTHITCLERARHCRPEEEPRGVAFMGVGFARRSAQGTPDEVARNPFVNLVSLASGAPVSSVRPGYRLTRSGAQLGLSEDSTRGFAFAKLAPAAGATSAAPQWQAATLTVAVDGAAGDGTLLMDTGIDYMFLSPPEGSGLVHGRAAPRGTRLEIWLPDVRQARARYAFTVGERRNPLEPERVEVVRDRGVFVNTGRLFLEGFDYLYDAAGGWVGYRWNDRVNGEFGGVTHAASPR